jgi:hypothetical protein
VRDAGLTWVKLWAWALTLLVACSEPPAATDARAHTHSLEASSDLTILPEFPLDTPTVGGARSGLVAFAWDGSKGLVLWSDGRSPNRLSRSLVGTDGSVIEQSGIELPHPVGHSRMAFNGQHHFLIWSTNVGSNFVIWGLRVSKAGTPLDSAPIQIVSVPRLYGYQVASNGQDFLVVWSDDDAPFHPIYTGESRLFAARVAAGGALLDTVAIQLDGGPSVGDFDVTWDGYNYVVAWTRSQHVVAIRVGADGTVRDHGPIGVSSTRNGQSTPDVERVGQKVWIAWAESAFTSEIRVARMDPVGVIFEPGGVPPVPVTAFNHQGKPQLIATGDSAVLVWHEVPTPGYLYSASLDSELRLSSGPHPLAEAFDPPSLAFDGTSILMVWNWIADRHTWGGSVLGRRLSASGAPLARAFPIATGPNEQDFPAAAWGGSGYLVAWKDLRSANGIYATVVSGSGEPMTDQAALIADDTISAPKVAAAGQEFLVAWRHYEYKNGGSVRLRARRVGDRGMPLDTAPIDFPLGDYFNWSVVGGNRCYLIVWGDGGDTEPSALRFARVEAGGTLLDTVPGTLAGNEFHSPHAVWNGQNFFAAWQRGSSLFVNWIEPEGEPVRGNALTLPFGTRQLKGVAWNGSSYLLLVTSPDAPPSGLALSSLDASASVLGPAVPVGTGGISFSNMETITWDGASFLLSWPHESGDVDGFYVARAGADGKLLDPAPELVTLASPLVYPETVALASSPHKHSLLAYSHFDSAPTVQRQRLRARRVVQQPSADGGADAGADGANTPATDASATDATTADSTPPDAMPADSTPPDAGMADSTADVSIPPDANTADSEVVDAATTDDVATDVTTSTDGPGADIGTADGAEKKDATADASTLDAAVKPEAGGAVDPSPESDEGCDCQLVSAPPSRPSGPVSAAIAALMLAWRLGRRRTRVAG